MATKCRLVPASWHDSVFGVLPTLDSWGWLLPQCPPPPVTPVIFIAYLAHIRNYNIVVYSIFYDDVWQCSYEWRTVRLAHKTRGFFRRFYCASLWWPEWGMVQLLIYANLFLTKNGDSKVLIYSCSGSMWSGWVTGHLLHHVFPLHG